MKQEFHEYRTSNALDWDTMLSLVRKLYRDGYYRLSLLIGCGAFFCLRISDTLSLTWSICCSTMISLLSMRRKPIRGE